MEVGINAFERVFGSRKALCHRRKAKLRKAGDVQVQNLGPYIRVF